MTSDRAYRALLPKSGRAVLADDPHGIRWVIWRQSWMPRYQLFAYRPTTGEVIHCPSPVAVRGAIRYLKRVGLDPTNIIRPSATESGAWIAEASSVLHERLATLHNTTARSDPAGSASGTSARTT